MLSSYISYSLTTSLKLILVILNLVTIIILDIIHRPVFYLKHNVPETRFCFVFQVKPTQLGAIDRASPCLHVY
jgi:hypothetical protein